MSEITELYRYFDKDSNLLYVGISKNAIARQSQHQGSSHWYNKATSSTIERFKSRDDALSAEKKAIKNENPIHNVIHAKKKNLKGIKPFLAGMKRVSVQVEIPYGVLCLYNGFTVVDAIVTILPADALGTTNYERGYMINTGSLKSAQKFCAYVKEYTGLSNGSQYIGFTSIVPEIKNQNEWLSIIDNYYQESHRMNLKFNFDSCATGENEVHDIVRGYNLNNDVDKVYNYGF